MNRKVRQRGNILQDTDAIWNLLITVQICCVLRCKWRDLVLYKQKHDENEQLSSIYLGFMRRWGAGDTFSCWWGDLVDV